MTKRTRRKLGAALKAGTALEKRLLKRAAGAFIAVLLACGTAVSSEQPVYAPATGLWLAPSDHSKRLYGPTSPDANWKVAQWNIPADLPPFADGASGNDYASVVFAGAGGYTLEQTTQNFPCEKKYPSGRTLVNELDLFASPNNQNDVGYPSAALHNRASLAALHHVHHEIDLDLLSVSVVDGDCPITQVGFVTALVLTNQKARQTLFYQLRPAVLRYRDGVMSTKMTEPGWFFTGENLQAGGHGQYGFSDNVGALGAAEATPGSTMAYSFELLPRLVEVIERGSDKGLDQDISHWILSGTFHGMGAFGHVHVRARWSGFVLTTD
jgi:hypothetical protein